MIRNNTQTFREMVNKDFKREEEDSPRRLSSNLLPTKESNDKSIEAKVKSIISTVMQRCKKESSCNSLFAPLEDYEQRASYYTAFPKSYFWQLQDEEKALKTEGQNFSIMQRICILQCMKDFYVNRKQLTYHTFYEAMKKFDSNMPEFVYFMRELSSIGYEYRYTKSGFVLIEDPIRRFERFNFLNKITKIRSDNRQLYYIDIRIIDNTCTFKKFTGRIDSKEKLFYFLFVHAISKNGYENGLFTNVLMEEDFVKWISDVLFTSLPPGTTIVIDSNPFFAHQKDSPITKYDTKSNMLKWLKDNNIPCNLNMHKAELYELVKSQVKMENFKLDDIFRAHGFKVLRLPYKLEALTPTDLMWKHIETIIKPQIVPEMDLITLKNLVRHTIDQIDSNKWTHFSVVIENWEQVIFEIDETIEVVLDNTYEIVTKNIVENVHIPEYFYSVKCRCEILNAMK